MSETPRTDAAQMLERGRRGGTTWEHRFNRFVEHAEMLERELLAEKAARVEAEREWDGAVSMVVYEGTLRLLRTYRERAESAEQSLRASSGEGLVAVPREQGEQLLAVIRRALPSHGTRSEDAINACEALSALLSAAPPQAHCASEIKEKKQMGNLAPTSGGGIDQVTATPNDEQTRRS